MAMCLLLSTRGDIACVGATALFGYTLGADHWPREIWYACVAVRPVWGTPSGLSLSTRWSSAGDVRSGAGDCRN